jgi:hypothetical protein
MRRVRVPPRLAIFNHLEQILTMLIAQDRGGLGAFASEIPLGP